jgi:hypothetical protein
MIDAIALASVRQDLNTARAHATEGAGEIALLALIDAIDALIANAQPVELARGWLPGAILWRCAACGRAIGKIAPGRILVSHEGREIEITGVAMTIRQKCATRLKHGGLCGHENTWPPPPGAGSPPGS